MVVARIALDGMSAAGPVVKPSAPGPDHAAEALRLFDDLGAPLFRFCLATLRDGADAEDVVQDTFVKLLQHLKRGGDRANLRSWLFTVAANACRDRARWKVRWVPWRLEHDERTVAPVEGRTETADAGIALARLAARDRLLLSLRAQGLSYRDIAAASGVREQSVGRLLARALERWKKAFDMVTGGRDGLPERR